MPFLILLFSSIVVLTPYLGGGSIIGSDLGDTYKHVWSFWHTYDLLGQLWEAGQLKTWPWTDKLSAPHGGFLMDVMLAPSIIFLPITHLFGPVVSSLSFIFVSFYLLGVTGYKLGALYNLNERSSIIVGFIAQSTPYMFGYPLASGVYERLSIWVFPLLWYSLLRFHQSGHRKMIAVSLGALSFVALSCQSYIIFAMLLLMIGLVHLRSKRALLFFILQIIPLFFIFLFIRHVTQSPWTLAPQPMRFSLFSGGPLVEESAKLSELFVPFISRRLTGEDSGDWLLRLGYVGLVPVGLCLWALWKKSSGRVCIGIGFLFLCLSLGKTIGPIPNVLYLLVAHLFPIYGSIPDAFQQLAVAMPFVSLGVMLGLEHCPSRLFWPLLGVLFVERVAALPHDKIWQTASDSVPTIYHKVEAGAIVSIPRQFQSRQLVSPAPFLYQMHHKQPMAISVYMGVTAWDAYAPIATGRAKSWKDALKCMRKGGLRWLMIHRDWFQEHKQGEAIVDRIELKPVEDDGVRVLYDLSELDIEPLSDVYLPPRNTRLPEEPPPALDTLHRDIFLMQQDKCPIDSAAQHHREP